MKITGVESYAIQAKPIDREAYWGSRAWGNERDVRGKEISVEYPVPTRRRFLYSSTIDTVIVKLTTDSGLVGFGEAKAPVAPQVTKKLVGLLLADLVIGEDPRDVSVLWEKMYAGMRVRGHSSGFYLEAMSGVDIALWDLAGQAAGAPLWRLLGGCFRNPFRVYASGLPAFPVDAPEEDFEHLAFEAQQIRKAGYTGLKMALGRGIEGDLKSVLTVRSRIGDSFLIYVDAAGVYDRTHALALGKRLQELRVGWFEMPTFPEDIEGYARLARDLTIPIALDSLTTRSETLNFLQHEALSVVQPDVCRAGGITGCRRIAELADAFGAAFAPHISIGSAVHFAATAHLAASMPNTLNCEYWIGENPLGNAILERPLILESGYLHVPDGAGLGIEVREQALLAHLGSDK